MKAESRQRHLLPTDDVRSRMGNVWLTSLPRQQSFVWGHKRIGWIVFVLLLTGFIPAGAYRTIRYEEARPPTPCTPSYR